MRKRKRKRKGKEEFPDPVLQLSAVSRREEGQSPRRLASRSGVGGNPVPLFLDEGRNGLREVEVEEREKREGGNRNERERGGRSNQGVAIEDRQERCTNEMGGARGGAYAVGLICISEIPGGGGIAY